MTRVKDRPWFYFTVFPTPATCGGLRAMVRDITEMLATLAWMVASLAPERCAASWSECWISRRRHSDAGRSEEGVFGTSLSDGGRYGCLGGQGEWSLAV